MAVIKFTNSKSSLKKIIDYITQPSKTEKRLISGKDCMPETALQEMMFVKDMYGKATGRQYIHIVQSFDPKDELTHERANDIGNQLAEHFNGFQAIVATHKDREHIHNHILLNSVNFETGLKFQQSKKDMQNLKEFSDKLCRDNNLSVIEKPNENTDIQRNEYQVAIKGQSWKINLILTIDEAMKASCSKQDFISNMNRLGYEVNWSDSRKYITYTTPDGKKCRDNKLHHKKYLKEGMENEFRKIEANTIGKSAAKFSTESKRITTDRKNIKTNEPHVKPHAGTEKVSIRERLESAKVEISYRENEKRNDEIDYSSNHNKHINSSRYKHDNIR